MAAAVTAVLLILAVFMVTQGWDQAGVWAGFLGAVAAVVAAVPVVRGFLASAAAGRLPPELEVPGWVVGRPAELGAVVRALGAGRGGTVGITTGCPARGVSARRRWRRWCVQTGGYGAGSGAGYTS